MRVEFTTVSHDQGWCNDRALRGTYHGFTWFEAAILRPSLAAASGSWLNRAGDAPVGLDTDLGYDPVLEVKAAHGGSRWHLQSNLCASDEDREHIVTWDADGTCHAGAAGAGDGAGFVPRRAHGDRIAVIARARYPGWSNPVQRVQISVYYGLV